MRHSRETQSVSLDQFLQIVKCVARGGVLRQSLAPSDACGSV